MTRLMYEQIVKGNVMNNFPAYHERVEDVPEYVEAVIVASRKYQVAYDDALAAAQHALDDFHTHPFFGSPDRDPWIGFIDNAVSYLDPFDDRTIVSSAQTQLYKAALKYWAREGNYNVSDVWEWFDNVIATYGNLSRIPYDAGVWEGFFERFPIELPRDENGKVDATKLNHMTDFQRALITSQSAEVAETCATGGGDDTWFDYLPNGIATLATLQSEEWAIAFAEYVNTMEQFQIPYVDEEDDARMDAEEVIAEKYGFFIQDVTSALVAHYF